MSIPLFAGSGAPIAGLNLYAHDPDPMTALTRQVWALYHTGTHHQHTPLPAVQPGSQQLLAAIAAAFTVRDLIQQALGALMARHHVTADTAYHMLHTTATHNHTTLPTTAAALIHDQNP
jgi:hypothetical protein